MFYKGRLLEGFRSLYAQSPAQSSVWGRTFFNAEVAEYAYKGHIASHNHSNLAQEEIHERITAFCATCKHITNYLFNFALLQGKNVCLFIFDLTVHVLFYSFIRCRDQFS